MGAFKIVVAGKRVANLHNEIYISKVGNTCDNFKYTHSVLHFGYYRILAYICSGTKNQVKGTEAFPSFIIMTKDTSIQAIETLINRLLADMEDVFLVSLRIKPTNNIKIFLDADGGLNIDRCVKINRAMYRIMEEEAWYPDGNFSLEISSPGIDEPLKMLRQYKKNIGRKVEVTLLDEIKQEGKLLSADEQNIQIEFTEGKNKKAVTIIKDIPFEQIKQTVVQIAF